MQMYVDLAVDRDPADLVSTFVEPLSARLQERGAGWVVRHACDELWMHVDLVVSDVADMDHVLECLAECDAPIGTMIYRRDEFGHDQDIFVLGPPPTE